MLNKEKYRDEIFKIACSGLRVSVNEYGEPVPCESQCDECLLNAYISCSKAVTDWCNKEYEECKEDIDWTKVPIDTPIIVEDEHGFHKRYFAKYENERIYTWWNGMTSWSKEDNFLSSWDNGRLAKFEELNESEKERSSLRSKNGE